ncbi:MFS transporter [Solihabitans fulvus]|uniref:MFS transporter n=1 Tax=Solihabitans fulvus TaxID=1892852 RepID=A0A5B2XB97_9PSEU|nr:MFS transporter [Solihabitans fulvus]KAA2260434.1 MFS transporter [Solihabitans fulvus]
MTTLRPGAAATRLLLPATFITALGNNIQLIASALLLVRSNSTMLAVGWLFIAVALPQAVLSPWFGRLADRFDRRRLWLACDLTSVVAALALPLGLAAGGSGDTVVYASNFALAVVSALFLPASAALIKERVPPADLRRFNAGYEIALQAGMLLSASIGGFALQRFGTTPLFVFNAATFAASALCVFAVGRRPTGLPVSATPVVESVTASAPLSTWRLIMLYAQGNIVVTVFNALMPILVLTEMRAGTGLVGIVDAVGGTGFLLAAAAYRAVGSRFTDLRIALVGYLATVLFLVLQPQFGTAGLIATVFCCAATYGQARIASRALLLVTAPPDRVGRVFGLANGIGLASTIVVMLVVSTVTDRTDTRYGFATLAAVTLVLTVVAVLTGRPGRSPSSRSA